jgi:hypothetical protein
MCKKDAAAPPNPVGGKSLSNGQLPGLAEKTAGTSSSNLYAQMNSADEFLLGDRNWYFDAQSAKILQ